MNMNLVAIAGVPPADLSGKLVGMGGCGCALGETPPTADQRNALDWAAVGFWGVALVIGYYLFREPARGR
jgi:hypothetical protein